MALLWERIWPPLAAFLTLAGLFLSLSWLGLWIFLPPIARAVGLALFAAAALVILWRLVRIRLPDEADALRRVDTNSGLSHRPATAVSDRLAVTRSDPMSAALWQAHIERALRAARMIVLTHYHADHAGGIVTAEDRNALARKTVATTDTLSISTRCLRPPWKRERFSRSTAHRVTSTWTVSSPAVPSGPGFSSASTAIATTPRGSAGRWIWASAPRAAAASKRGM